jgi:hypothetical protein
VETGTMTHAKGTKLKKKWRTDITAKCFGEIGHSCRD